MAELIAISGSSSTGKTTLINYLKMNPKIKNMSVVCTEDLFKSVWDDLVMNNHFNEYDDITRDPDYLCIFLHRVLDRYNQLLQSYKDAPYDYVIFDCCWLDLLVYGQVNMWYTHILKDLQTNIMSSIIKNRDMISKIYMTVDDESMRSKEKFRCPYKKYNLKYDHDLELMYYDLYTSLGNVKKLPNSDLSDCIECIIGDLSV